MNLLKVLALLICIISSTAFAENPTKIKIGVSTPLTGNAATYGMDVRNALEFSNKKLTNNAYKLIFEDDKCSPKDAVNIAKKLVTIDKVNFVLGFACSGPTLASAPVYEANKVVVIAAGASAAEISAAGQYIFRTAPNDNNSAQMLYSYIATQHKKIGILSEETDFPQNLLRSFTAANKNNEIEIINENFLTDTLDYKSPLTKLLSKKVDAIFLNTQAEPTLLAALKQLRTLSKDLQVYVAYYGSSPSFLDNAKELAENIIFVDLPSAAGILTKEGRNLYQQFIKEYGNPISLDTIVLTTIESFRAMHQAVTSHSNAITYLNATEFDGTFGKWRFDSNGDIVGINFVMKKIEGGKVVTLK